VALKKQLLPFALSVVTISLIIAREKSNQNNINKCAHQIATAKEVNDQKRIIQEELRRHKQQLNIDGISPSEYMDILLLSNYRIQVFHIAFDKNSFEGIEVEIPADYFKKRNCFLEHIIVFGSWYLFVFFVMVLKQNTKNNKSK
jgi:hypothetical protein